MSAVPSPHTIVGVATGTPDGGVAIVRLSGNEASAIAGRSVGTLPPPRVLARRGLCVDAESEAGARENALVVFMPGPESYTGEDVVELHVHSGERNVRSVVERLLANGAVAAGPGDFTRRAFCNGRLSLDQAEGIAALIGARTEAELEQGRRLVAGEVGRDVERQRARLAEIRTELEASLDSADDIETNDISGWAAEVEVVGREVAGWLRRFEAGRRARERARIVLAGPPNAGKSTLFNRLLERVRTVVSEEPGTTRDYVEAEWTVGPFAAVLVDTAGLTERGDVVDGGMLALSREQVEGADVVIWLEGADAEPERAEPWSARGDETVLLVEAKRDLGARRDGWLGVSAKTGAGLDELRARLRNHFEVGGETAWIGLARHRDRAKEALAAITRAAQELGRGATELAAFELDVAEGRLGEICGRTRLGPIGAEVLDRIFARFCVGK